MGRPKKKIEEIKLFQINIRVSLSDQVKLEEEASARGLNVVELIRRKALQFQIPKYSISGLERTTIIELSRIGNNINQMSKKVNQGNPNLKGLEEELLNLNKKLNEIKNQLLV
jgi:septal ring factor EnvC (AmiA/AmiB activator)